MEKYLKALKIGKFLFLHKTENLMKHFDLKKFKKAFKALKTYS